MQSDDKRQAGPALIRCNRCGCIAPRLWGPRAMFGLQFIFAKYSLRSNSVETAYKISLLANNALVRTNFDTKDERLSPLTQTLFSLCPQTFSFVMALMLASSKTVGSCVVTQTTFNS